jgi:toxin ParE1/3/4
MARYELSNAADRDFEGIFDFGIDRFGFAQALAYQDGLKQRFADLAAHPERYPTVDHIREGYRRCVYGSHAIYYRVEPERVFIVRILGQQDPQTALEE